LPAQTAFLSVRTSGRLAYIDQKAGDRLQPGNRREPAQPQRQTAGRMQAGPGMTTKPSASAGRSIRRLPVVLAVVLGGCVLVLALAVVRLNIERMYLGYELRQLQTEVERKTDLHAKLEVERMNLLSSARLRLLAEESGLHPAGPGQVRILTIP